MRPLAVSPRALKKRPAWARKRAGHRIPEGGGDG